MELWIFILIYILGYVVSYYTMRWEQRDHFKEMGLTWEWTDVKFTAIMSICSWFTVIGSLIFLVSRYIEKRMKLPSGDPPKWL